MASDITSRLGGARSALAFKAPCRVATTAHIDLTGLRTVDGVTTAVGDRVLVKNQNTASENGIYTVKATAWTRALDFDGADDVVTGTRVYVHSGSAGVGVYKITTADPITIGTSSITFTLDATEGMTSIGTLEELKDVNTSTTTSVYVRGRTANGDGWGGVFVWRTGDYSTLVAADTRQAIYVASDNVASTSGAWVRQYDTRILSSWFNVNASDAQPAIQALINHPDTIKKRVVAGTYTMLAKLVLKSDLDIEFDENAYLRREWTEANSIDAIIVSHTTFNGASPLTNVRFSGGKFGADSYDYDGAIFVIWCDNSTFKSINCTKWTGGQAFLWGGSRLNLVDINALEGDPDNTGTGPFRFIGGTDSHAHNCHGKAADDGLQFAPLAPSAAAYTDLDCLRSSYVQCSATSTKGRPFVALLIDNDTYVAAAAVTFGSGTTTVTIAGHGMIAGDMCRFATTGALPAEATAATNYWVVSPITTDTFAISATRGGSAITFSSAGTGDHTADYKFGGMISSIRDCGWTNCNGIASGSTSGGCRIENEDSSGEIDNVFWTDCSIDMAGNTSTNAAVVVLKDAAVYPAVGPLRNIRLNGAVRGFYTEAVRVDGVTDIEANLDIGPNASAATSIVEVRSSSGGKMRINARPNAGSTILRAGQSGLTVSDMAFEVIARPTEWNSSTTYMINFQTATRCRIERLEVYPQTTGGVGTEGTRGATIAAAATNTWIDNTYLSLLATGVANRIVNSGVGTRIGEQVIGWDQRAPFQTLTDAASITWNMANGRNAQVTLADNRTLSNPSNPRVGNEGYLLVIQDGTGGRTLTWSSSYVSPTGGTPRAPSATAGATTRYAYHVETTSRIVIRALDTVYGPVAGSTDSHFAQFDGTSGNILKGGIALDTDTTMAANSDTRLPSQKAVRGYAVGLTDLAATTSGKGAALVGIEDTGAYYAGATVEAALQEIGADITALDQAIVLKGTWNPTSGTFPGGGTAQSGWKYLVDGSATVDGVAFQTGDSITAIIDNASTTTYAANWHKIDSTDIVTSVAGRTGAVTLAQADVSGLTTSDSPQFAGLNVGHASDTTVTRASAGRIAVEGVEVALNSTTETHTVQQIEVGHATDTTLTRASAGVLAVEGVELARNSVSVAHTAATLELGHSSDTTLSRVSAGVVAVEGVELARNDITAAHTAASIELGHASDTTLTRTGAGDIAVEGNAVYRAGGTDVPVADGGTGASTAAAARTNLEAAWSGFDLITSSSTISAGAITITSLSQAYSHLIIVVDRCSHDSGSSAYLKIEASMDNGSTWPLAVAVTPSAAASSNFTGSARLAHYSASAKTKYLVATGGSSVNFASVSSDATADTVDAIRVTSSGGNIDGTGTLYIFGS